jgi:hypothetical protein
MKRSMKWTKFSIGFQDDEMINNLEVIIDEGNLVGFSDNEPTLA